MATEKQPIVVSTIDDWPQQEVGEATRTKRPETITPRSTRARDMQYSPPAPSTSGRIELVSRILVPVDLTPIGEAKLPVAQEYARAFAAEVGDKGKVYAVDISKKFLDHIAKTAKDQRLTNVETVLGTDVSVELKPGSVDVVFICDTYVNADPDAGEIAEMTLLAADAMKRFGIAPKVALLSASSFGSLRTASAANAASMCGDTASRPPAACSWSR